MVYKWRDGFRASGKVTPEVAGEELERIRIAHGGLEPRVIVDAARVETNPLHPAFTWNDEAAAEAYRLHEARAMVRSLVVVFRDAATEHQEPMYVSTVTKVDESERRFYQRATILVNRPDELDAAIAMLYGKMQSAAAALDDVRRLAEKAENRRAVKALKGAQVNMAAASEAIREMRQ